MKKCNNVTANNFFRSSNHRGVSAPEQIFYKKHRAHHLENAGCARVKKEYKWPNSHLVCHTIKTCTANCTCCGSPVYCALLVKHEDRYHSKCTLPADAANNK